MPPPEMGLSIGDPSAVAPPIETAQRPASRRLRRRALAALAPTGVVVAALVVWQVLGSVPSLRATVPSFTTVLRWFAQTVGTSVFWATTGDTMLQWALGLLLGCAAGIVLGLVMGLSRTAHQLLDVIVEFLRPIPAVVYLPLLILLYGNTDTMAVVSVGSGVVWILLFQTFYGVRDLSPLLLDTGRVFGLSRRQRLVRLVLPSISPYMATGVRIASSTAFLIAVSVELIGGAPGLGFALGNAESNGLYPAMYGFAAVCGVIAVVVNSGIVQVERAGLAWHHAQHAGEAR